MSATSSRKRISLPQAKQSSSRTFSRNSAVVLAGGNTSTTYSYNHDRQLTMVLRPDGDSISFAYDTAGRVATMTEPLGQHIFTYDASKGTLSSISSPSGNGLEFTYDGNLL